MSTVAAAPPGIVVSAGKALGRLAGQVYAAAKAGAASALGVAGMAMVAVGVGIVSRPGFGIIVGGILAIWLASLLPGGDQ